MAVIQHSKSKDEKEQKILAEVKEREFRTATAGKYIVAFVTKRIQVQYLLVWQT